MGIVRNNRESAQSKQGRKGPAIRKFPEKPVAEKKAADPKPRQKQEELNSELIRVAEEGKVDEISRLIKAGAEIDWIDKNGWTALRGATSFRQLECMEKLLDLGADPNHNSSNGAAILYTVTTGFVEGLRLLIERGAKTDIKNEKGETVLLAAELNFVNEAEGVEIIGLIIENGIEINAMAKNGASALDRIVRRGNAQCALVLFQAGAKSGKELRGEATETDLWLDRVTTVANILKLDDPRLTIEETLEEFTKDPNPDVVRKAQMALDYLLHAKIEDD